MRPIHKVKYKKDSREMSSSLIGIKCPSLPVAAASIQNLSQSVGNFSKFNVASPKKKILLQNNL
jgi:hypothetical protein